MKSHPVIIIIIFAGLICPPLFANNIELADQSEPNYSSSIASQYQGTFQDQALLASNGDAYSRNVYYPEYKSESTATMLALFPGFFIHGMGHIYANDYLTASILLALEIASFPLLNAGVSWFYVAENEDRRVLFTIAGLTCFFGSWLVDVIHADAAVREYNDKIRSQIYLRSNQSGRIDVGLAFSF
jgi:hypothetical protein